MNSTNRTPLPYSKRTMSKIERSFLDSCLNALATCLGCRYFRISGNERVKHTKLCEDDFNLPEETHIADYNKESLAKYWNSKIRHRHKIAKQIYSSFRHGLLHRSIPILVVFLLGYYTFHIGVMTYICGHYIDLKNSLERDLTKNHSSASEGLSMTDQFCKE